MGKQNQSVRKSSRRPIASSKSANSSHIQNPFDAKFNREKESVLGKKPLNMAHGKPGMAKRKMIDKRAKTLLNEYRGTRRSGTFEDSRLGEADSKLSVDEKMFMRYAAERKKSFESKLSEPQLSRGEKLVITERSKKSAEHSYGGMSEQAVAEIHFGKGGQDTARKDWRDRLDQIISDSKRAKFEKHAERYETGDKVDELDQDWSSLRGAIFAAGAPLPPETAKAVASEQQGDLFDKVVKELRFEQCPDHHKIVEAQQASVANERKRRRFEEETETQLTVGFASQAKGLPFHVSADALEEDIIALSKKSNKRKMTEKDNTFFHDTEEPKFRVHAFKSKIEMSFSGSNLLTILQELRTEYNPELHPNNKEIFVAHFVYFLNQVFGAENSEKEQPPVCTLLSDLNDSINFLFELIRTYGSHAEAAIRSAISTHIRALCQPCEELSLDQVGRCYCLLKLVAAVFPTSDFFHPIVTPAFALLAVALRTIATVVSSPSFTISPNALSVVCLGLAFIDLSIQFVSRSRRYFPEAIVCFIHVLGALSDLKQVSNLLDKNEKCPFNTLPCHHSIDAFIDKSLLIANFICNLWADIPGNQVFFRDIVLCLQKMVTENPKVNDVLESFAKCISKPLVPLKPKTKPAEEIKELPSFAPRITTTTESKQKKKESAAAKTTHLKRQLRKEYRHAVRELRRDNEFLARQHLVDRLADDEERERKTKRILGQLAMQEGECRKFGR